MEDWAFQENYWEDGLPPLKTLDHQRRVAIREQKRKEVVFWPSEPLENPRCYLFTARLRNRARERVLPGFVEEE